MFNSQMSFSFLCIFFLCVFLGEVLPKGKKSTSACRWTFGLNCYKLEHPEIYKFMFATSASIVQSIFSSTTFLFYICPTYATCTPFLRLYDAYFFRSSTSRFYLQKMPPIFPVLFGYKGFLSVWVATIRVLVITLCK